MRDPPLFSPFPSRKKLRVITECYLWVTIADLTVPLLFKPLKIKFYVLLSP